MPDVVVVGAGATEIATAYNRIVARGDTIGVTVAAAHPAG
jgi:hypothetical protein